MNFDHDSDYSRSITILSVMRWLLPIGIAILGFGYALSSHPPVPEWMYSSLDVFNHVWFSLLIPPIIIWLFANWNLHLTHELVDKHQAIAYRDRELVALNAIGEVAAQSLDLDTILQRGLERILQLVGAPAGEVRVLEGDRLIVKARAGIAPTYETEPEVRIGECVCGKSVTLRMLTAVKDLSEDPARRNMPCARAGFKSLISIPMIAKGEVNGVVLLASPLPNVFGPADQRILTAMGTRMAAAVENAKLYKETRRRALHLETASLLGSRMTALLELDALVAEVVKLIGDQFGYYHTDLFLVEEETDEVVLKEASGPSAPAVKASGLRLKIGKEGIVGWVAKTGQPVLCNDVSRDPRFLSTELVPETKAELAVPLTVGNRVIGVLDVQSAHPGVFDEEDATVLGILGNQIGIAIENARLFQETKHRYEALAALHETSLDIASRFDTPQLLEALLRRGAQLLGARGGVLFVYDTQQNVIRVNASYNTWRDWAGVTLKLGEGVVSQVLLTGKPAIINDYHNWPGRAPVFAGSSETRIVGVPLRWENETIGVLDITNDADGRPFDDQDVWLLSQFADLASIAIKNAELHSQIRQFSQELEQKVRARTQELSEAKEELATRSEQLRSLLAKTIRVQEDEQARIARDMHDSVVQLVSSTRYELDAAGISLKTGLSTTAQEKLQTARQLLDEVEGEIRRAIYDLHPPSLDAVGLPKSLEKYTNRYALISGVLCSLQVTGNPVRLPLQSEGSLYRMIVEALSNVAAHSDASEVRVRLEYEYPHLQIMVDDNGCGFDVRDWLSGSKRNGAHLGLLGMQERVESLGGSMHVEAAPGCGTRLSFRVPISRVEAEWGSFEF